LEKRGDTKDPERGGKMKKYKIAVLLLVAFMIIFFGGLYLYNIYSIKEVKVLKMHLEINNSKLGFNAGTDALYFGKTYAGSTVKRIINITNEYDFPISVSIKVTGNISEFITISQNDFIVQPGEMKVITYYATTNIDTLEGSYEGETRALFTRAMQ
jgi:hypothetical protein